MEKSVHTSEYARFLVFLRELRKESGMTQVELAERLDQTQSFVSKCERGERRLDIIQLRTICLALGTTLPAFAQKLEQRLPKPKRWQRTRK